MTARRSETSSSETVPISDRTKPRPVQTTAELILQLRCIYTPIF